MPLTAREQELLRLLDGYLAHLQATQTLDPSILEPSGMEDAAVQRWLQLSVQCCLDLGDSILGRLGEPEPARYRDIFAALVRRGVIDASLAAPMEQLTDFRNALAHAYADLSPTETWRRVRDGLPILAEFARQIARQ
jgi:uncharacterized protein YutE (UPF0331/DUF86 family)